MKAEQLIIGGIYQRTNGDEQELIYKGNTGYLYDFIGMEFDEETGSLQEGKEEFRLTESEVKKLEWIGGKEW